MNLFLKLLRKVLTSGARSSAAASSGSSGAKRAAVNRKLADSLHEIKSALGNSTDLIVRTYSTGDGSSQPMALVYIEGLANAQPVLDALAVTLQEQSMRQNHRTDVEGDQYFERLFVPIGIVKKAKDFRAVMQGLLSGEIVVLREGVDTAALLGARSWKERSIEEPSAEPSVRGPRDGFTETLRTNTSLLRRRIKDPRLWLETMYIGKVTQTEVSLMYIKGLVSENVLTEARRRLAEIDVDSILESGYIQEFIQDKTLTPFPLVFNSERPDVIAAELLEGRIAILVDNTPFVLIVPAMFAQFMQAAEDHYQRWDFATFIRSVRYLSLFINLLAPALYIALVSYHQEILPPQLLISLAAAREGVPFPVFIEAMIMEMTFEILREAGVRMPKTIGQAVSIVGTLVIGQAAVEAGLVSPAMVIVVAMTAISNFVIPAYSLAISYRLLRFFIMCLAGALGFFGILLGCMAIVFHMCSLQSFGVPYLSSFAPFHASDQKDAIFRMPRWLMLTRPSYMKRRDYVRMNSGKRKP